MPQRRLVSTAANEVLYQPSPAPTVTHSHIHYTHLHMQKALTLINALAGTRVYCICTVTHETLVLQAGMYDRLHTSTAQMQTQGPALAPASL